MAILVGKAFVLNADGKVTIAGTAQLNTVNNADVSDASEIKTITDAKGKTATLYKDETIKKISVEITPGGTIAGADGVMTDAIAAAVMPTKLSTLKLENFKIAAFNDSYVIMEDSPVKIVSNGAATISVKGTKFEKDFTTLTQLDTLATGS